VKYRIRRVSTSSIARFGCLLGWIVTVIPGLACGLLGWQAMAVVRDWLQSWEQINVDLLGFEATLDLIDLLQLKDVLAAMQTVENRVVPLLILLAVAAAVLGGLLVAFMLILLGWGYNLLAGLTGGVMVELQAVPGPGDQGIRDLGLRD
jgi:hypothetical protein